MRKFGFTLIELLIVVAIIAILAAIAVPNFLEAQTRAKVSRAKADMRSLDTAIMSYFIDNNNVFPDSQHVTPVITMLGENPNANLDAVIGPDSTAPDVPKGSHLRWNLRTLKPWRYVTTPIAYFTAIPIDPFSASIPLQYESYYQSSKTTMSVVESWGPDKKIDRLGNVGNNVPLWIYPNLTYDPTNGTVSAGDIARPVCVKDLSVGKALFGSDFDGAIH